MPKVKEVNVLCVVQNTERFKDAFMVVLASEPKDTWDERLAAELGWSTDDNPMMACFRGVEDFLEQFAWQLITLEVTGSWKVKEKE